MWANGRNPAITYVPSFGLMDQLFRRAAARVEDVLGVAVCTVAPEGDSADPLRDAHVALLAALNDAGRPVYESHAPTRDGLMAPATTAGIQHLLAHGIFRSGADALASGLVLGDTSGQTSDMFTASDVLTLDSCPGHVTVQACSLGGTVPSQGDELWGFTRALLAAGANSVMAPLWNIDLTSSTSLLARFYSRWLVDGSPKWRAWADAQHEMAWLDEESSPWRHLYHWAPFRMIGI
jgi:CHAT domain-containing protein